MVNNDFIIIAEEGCMEYINWATTHRLSNEDRKLSKIKSDIVAALMGSALRHGVHDKKNLVLICQIGYDAFENSPEIKKQLAIRGYRNYEEFLRAIAGPNPEY